MNSNSLAKAEQKVKELKEALQVCEKIAWKAQWAQDFTSYPCIQEAMERILEVVGDTEQDLNRELDYVDNQIEDYEFKLAMFESQNTIEV